MEAISLNRRILIVDDNASIHEDFMEILTPENHRDRALALGERLFGKGAGNPGEGPGAERRIDFMIDSAYQGEEGVGMVADALSAGTPYAVAFVDIRMPPGMDGVKTVKRIWEKDPELQVVLCTAYSDYSWEDIRGELSFSDNLLILKKPFENAEVRQLAGALSEKWNISRTVATKVEELEAEVERRKRSEAELKRVRNYLSGIIGAMPSVLVGVDTRDRVTLWNPEAEKATGIEAARARGSHLSAVLPQLSARIGDIHRSREAGTPLRNEKLLTHVNGRERFSDLVVYPLSMEGGEGVVLRIDDVTERVRLEETMVQAEKMVSVGGLAAGVAHEINNPLAGILQNAQVIRSRATENTARNREAAEACGISMTSMAAYMERRGIPAMLDGISKSGARAAEIIENMLSFSRKSESMAPHPLHLLLERTVELASSDYDLKKRYDFRNIEIIREYDPDLPDVPCEAGKMQQVFFNLLKNGAQAMAEKKRKAGRLILRIRKSHRVMRVEIEDNGPGMDRETLQRVFEPFFTTKGTGIGTGLGLSVSYFIVTRHHGGSMEVVSSPGGGAKFIIRLPLDEKSG